MGKLKYNEIKLSYMCPSFPPEGVSVDKVYYIVKKDNKLYFTDGVVEFEGNEDYIKMLFSPTENKIEWEDVDFNDDVEITKTYNKK